MKRRLVFAIIALVLAYVAYEQVKGSVKHWYAGRYFERPTLAPSSATPDQVCLTPAGNPQTEQAVGWRTSAAVSDGWVEYGRADGPEGVAPLVVEAVRGAIEDKQVKNDPVNHRFSAVMAGLEAGTTYRYRVGSREVGNWSPWHSFKTAPAGNENFSFVYLGDAQIGLQRFGSVAKKAFDASPAAAFYIVAGDLVNRGNFRNEWDEYFKESAGIFEQRTTLPALGNHDYSRDAVPHMYLEIFTLPANGPKDLLPELAYTYRYGNALFVVLDSNLPPAGQAQWLEEQLSTTDATWKFVVFHHPLYSSVAHRDNPEVREHWEPIFDKYHVDVAFQGHDHAYLRTHPMKGGKRAASAAEGTYYLVSVSGTKYYEQGDFDYSAVAFTKVSTYQIIDIEVGPVNKLTYRAYDEEGALRDEFVIEK